MAIDWHSTPLDDDAFLKLIMNHTPLNDYIKADWELKTHPKESLELEALSRVHMDVRHASVRSRDKRVTLPVYDMQQVFDYIRRLENELTKQAECVHKGSDDERLLPTELRSKDQRR